MGDIWAAIPVVQGYETGVSELAEGSLDNVDFFTPAYHITLEKNIYVSEKAKDWLDQNAEGHVCFDSTPVRIKEISGQERTVLQNTVERRRIRAEKEAVMTDSDWRRWFKLTDEAKKLAKERHNAKSAAVKARRTANAIDRLLEADKLYPVTPALEDLLAELRREPS